MPRVSTREASGQIRNLQPFTTNGSLRGEWQHGAYVVTSYQTDIAEINPTAGTAILNGQKYSSTTSRHQAVVRLGVHYLGEAMPLEVEEMATAREFLERLRA